VITDYHHAAAARILPAVRRRLATAASCVTVSIAGESGSGKSETAQALAEALGELGITCGICQQDDYFVLPPKSNDARRREGIDWVGTGEVRLALLDEHLLAARDGDGAVVKPLVLYDEDTVVEETMSLQGLQVLIAEGTYCTTLRHVDTRVFIARNRLETLAARKKRAREDMDPFIEEVLKIEHAIISQHRANADIVITRDYGVEIP